MSKKIKTNPDICAHCKYHMGFGSQPGVNQIDLGMMAHVACNYLTITGHSRIFQKDEMRFKPEYCDKFEPGDKICRAWTSDNMTDWQAVSNKHDLWKELENANYDGKH